MFRQLARTGASTGAKSSMWTKSGARMTLSTSRALARGSNSPVKATNGNLVARKAATINANSLYRVPGGIRSYSISTTGEYVESKIDDISLSQYNSISNEYLETMADELEALSEDYPEVDAELTQGVLTLTVPPNGTYVINKQPPNKQIWLSSPISGPKRYDLIGGRWITLRDNTSLTELIEEEISLALETDFSFEGLEN